MLACCVILIIAQRVVETLIETEDELRIVLIILYIHFHILNRRYSKSSCYIDFAFKIREISQLYIINMTLAKIT